MYFQDVVQVVGDVDQLWIVCVMLYGFVDQVVVVVVFGDVVFGCRGFYCCMQVFQLLYVGIIDVFDCFVCVMVFQYGYYWEQLVEVFQC